MMGESEWNWPLIIVFVVLFGGMAIWMSIPEGSIITETCTTIDNITKCVITETYT